MGPQDPGEGVLVALIDPAAREIRAKIVYYGPGLGGKTTNLLQIHRRLAPEAKGSLHSIRAADQRTLFFDFLPLDLGQVAGFSVRFQLYTVPGQVTYEPTRLAVLSGVDGAVFVADAQQERLDDNLASLTELARYVERRGKSLVDLPLVLQYNKMDLPNALAPATLDATLNQRGVPRFPASALRGDGVFETLRAISKLVAAAL